MLYNMTDSTELKSDGLPA